MVMGIRLDGLHGDCIVGLAGVCGCILLLAMK
jgi:hypothetical protein